MTLVVDAHMHVPRLSTVSEAWYQWAADYGTPTWRDVFDDHGDPDPAKLAALLDAEGVDIAMLFAEYSPRTTGVQPIEDVQRVAAANPHRFRLVANVNPIAHAKPAAEAERQLGLGAVAVKLHPVHGGFDPGGKDLVPVYELCADRQVPVIVHTGPSIFPGSVNESGDPDLMRQVLDRFPGLTVVLAHGGRAHWYAAAARMALEYQDVWLDIAGLPPKRLPHYYAGFDLNRLAGKWIFGTDWPGVPGTAANIRTVAALGLEPGTLNNVLGGNAVQVYRLG